MSTHTAVFLSYSSKDEALATRLSRRIRRYTPPPGTGVRNKHLTVVRDKDRFTAAPSLPDLLIERVQSVDWLVLLCSPNASHSTYVDLEVATFLRTHGLERIVFVLGQGEFATSLPQVLANTTREPLYIDMRDCRRHAFRMASLRLIAALYEVDFNELWREDERHGRRMRFRWTCGILLLAFLVVSAYLIASTAPDTWDRLPQPDSREQFNWRDGSLPVHDIAISRDNPELRLYLGRNPAWPLGPLPPTFSATPDLNPREFANRAAARLKTVPTDFCIAGHVTATFSLDGVPLGCVATTLQALHDESRSLRFVRLAEVFSITDTMCVSLSPIPAMLIPSNNSPFDVGFAVDEVLAAHPEVGRVSTLDIEGTVTDALTGKQRQMTFSLEDLIDPYDTWDEYLDRKIKVFSSIDPARITIDRRSLAAHQHDEQLWQRISDSPQWVTYTPPQGTDLGHFESSDVSSDSSSDVPNGTERPFREMAAKVPRVSDVPLLARAIAEVWPAENEITFGQHLAVPTTVPDRQAALIRLSGLGERQGDGYHPQGQQAWLAQIGSSPWRPLDIPSVDIIGLWALSRDDALVLTADQGFYRTRDAGRTWSEANYNETGFSAGRNVKLLVVDGPESTFALLDRGSQRGDPENPLYRLRRRNWFERWRYGLARMLHVDTDHLPASANRP